MTKPTYLRCLLGAGLLGAAALTAQAQNPVFFQVDMTTQPSAASVYVKGSFDSWGAGQLLNNNGSGVYTGTVNMAQSPGTVIACKFMFDPGGNWESFSPDRQFVIAGGAQTLPLTTWNVSDWPVPTENVTFQVDMSRYTNSLGQQAATLVDVRGAFNGWGAGSTLINNGANVYTNTFAVAGFAGGKFQYKFTYTTPPGVTWETDNPPPGSGQPADEGNNRVLQLTGVGQVLPVVPFYAPGVTPPLDFFDNSITYRVDMTEQIRLGNFLPGDEVRVTGAPAAITAWGAGVLMTNNPALTGDASNIYSAVVIIQGAPGTSGGAFKFRMNGNWEETSDGVDRNFTIAPGNAQVLPVYYYWDQPLGDATNVNLKFQVDMTPQVLSGAFTNGVSSVNVSGFFNGWGAGTPMTNDPALSGSASNVYSTWITIANGPGTIPTTSVGLMNRYKFRMSPDGTDTSRLWENAAIYGIGQNKDRRLTIVGGDQVLALVTYNDASLCDVKVTPTAVAFVLHVPNGRLDNNGIPFDKVNDHIYMNGDFLAWPAWTTSLPELTNYPVGSDFYQVVMNIPGGTRRLQYKFGVDGPNHGVNLDNENPTYQDHVKYIRNDAASYTLPVSEFGNLYLSSLVEPVFGNLAVGAVAGGNAPITWLGGPCVTLQSRASLTGGAWTDYPTTSSAASTNWPATGSQQFFRLQKRPQP